ncbi:zinc-ribbon domain-containing protein [Streptomyces griseoviridis]|uniref:zinc-ribbon domain-containing protein n=1 Tax=Streptomyces griseoviridis TaxID=45398 RepID=UPI0033ED61C9
MDDRCPWQLSGSAVMGKRRSATEVTAVRARLKTEFVSNLSSPGTALEDIPLSSTDRCQWRCSAEGCDHEWRTRLQFRTRTVNPSGCPECAKRRNRAPGPGEALADLNPALVRQFRRNLSRPDRGPDTLRPQSHDLCEWECAQGHIWPATLANRTNGRGCPDCIGHGRSPFECNVAMLVEAASGVSVELDHRLRLPGRSQDRFDLYLPEPAPGLLIDLDPEWTHNRPGSLERDTAKTAAALAAGLDVERIRSRGLPPVPVPGLIHHEAGPGVDPEDWAEAVGVVLRHRGLPWRQLTPAEVLAALTKGVQLWERAVAGPEVSAADVAPHLEAEFVANLTNPGRGPDRMPPGCNDVCVWRCGQPGCGYEWQAALHSRALGGRGCSRCASTRVGVANSRPGAGESLAEVNPAMAAELIEVVDHIGWTAFDLLPGSNKTCRWRCSDCRFEYPAPPNRRTGQSSGCPRCARQRTSTARVRPKPGRSLQDVHPALADELLEVIGESNLTAKELRPSSAKLCRWACSKPGCPGRWEATPDQRSRRGGTGKRCPVCHPPRKSRTQQ